MIKINDSVKNNQHGKFQSRPDRRKGVRMVKTSLFASALVVSLLLGAVSAYAAPRVPEDVTQEEYDKLQDNTVEWDEIGNLVEYYSPLFAGMKEVQENNSIAEIKKVRDAWQTELDDAKRKENNLRDDMDDASDPMQKAELSYEYAVAKATRIAYQKARAGYGKAVKTAEKKIDRAFAAQKPQLVNGMEQAFIGAKQLEQALAVQTEQVAMYTAAYQAKAASVQAGLATQAELLAAQYSMDDANNQLAATKERFSQLKRSLGITLGWSAESAENISFGALPAYDLNYLDGRNLQADIETAKLANKDLGTAKRQQGYSSADRKRREASVAETEEKVRIQMETMYQTIREKRAVYDAAQAGLDAARLSKDAAERKLALGLAGNAEYEALKLQYIAQEAQANTAQMEYFSAVFDYEWAMKGIVTLE